MLLKFEVEVENSRIFEFIAILIISVKIYKYLSHLWAISGYFHFFFYLLFYTHHSPWW